MNVTARFLEDRWPLANVKMEGLLQKFDNREVGWFSSAQGDFVYKLIPENFERAECERKTFIFDFLAEKNFPHAPRLLHTRDDERFALCGGFYIHVMEKIDGAHAPPLPDHYKQLGEIMGRLNAIKDYPYPTCITVNAIRPDFPGLSMHLPERLRGGYLSLARNLPSLENLPQSLIHFEMNLSANSIMRPDGALVILDWDEAGTGAAVLDPGYLLISQFISEDCRFDEAGARAFYQGYMSERPLSEDEKSYLFDASLFHALRYIVWGDVEKRWSRIEWAVRNKDRLLSLCFV